MRSSADTTKSSLHAENNKRQVVIASSFIIVLFFTAFYKSISAVLVHGFTWHLLIPCISAYIIWLNKNGFSGNQLHPSLTSGLSLIIAAFVMLFIGDATSTLVISELAIVTGIWGLVFCIGGFSLFKKLFWPLIYLLFISSSTEGLFDLFTPQFRYITAFLSVSMAKFAGYSVLLTETYIRLPDMVLNVANECSGVNHLVSLIAIALPLAFLTQRKSWAIILLIVSAVPVALFSNSIRVFILILYNFNRQVFTHGPKNIFVTATGFFIGLALLFLFASILTKLTASKTAGTNTVTNKPAACSKLTSLPFRPTIITAAVLFCGTLFFASWNVKDDLAVPDFSVLESSRNTVRLQKITSIQALDSLPIADRESYFSISDSSIPTYLYIGWYEKQHQGKEIAGYSYDKILKYYGTISVLTKDNKIVNLRICKPKLVETNTTCWIVYRSKNRYTSNPFTSKLYTAIDAFFHRTTSASIIIFVMPDSLSTQLINSKNNKFPFISDLLPVIDSAYSNQSTLN